MSPSGEQWKGSPRQPASADARRPRLPLKRQHGRRCLAWRCACYDAYVAEAGTLAVAVLGLFRSPTSHGRARLPRASLMRYLAEAAWYRPALLNQPGRRLDGGDDVPRNATLGTATSGDDCVQPSTTLV